MELQARLCWFIQICDLVLSSLEVSWDRACTQRKQWYLRQLKSVSISSSSWVGQGVANIPYKALLNPPRWMYRLPSIALGATDESGQVWRQKRPNISWQTPTSRFPFTLDSSQRPWLRAQVVISLYPIGDTPRTLWAGSSCSFDCIDC